VTHDTEADNPVTVEEYRLALQRLLVGWKIHSVQGVEIPRGREGVLRLVYPWVAQTHRFGAAALRLDKQGFGHESHVLVRSALEHALMAHWVSIAGDGAVTARYAEDHRLLERMLLEAQGRPRDVGTSTWDLNLLAEIVDAREPAGANESKVLRKIDQICERLGLGNTIYPAYRIHSWYVHPTTHTSDIYIEDRGGGLFGLRDKPADTASPAALGMMTHCVYWARRVLDDMTKRRPHEGWLDEIAASIKVTVRLPELSEE
jgi:hypothetical protein